MHVPASSPGRGAEAPTTSCAGVQLPRLRTRFLCCLLPQGGQGGAARRRHPSGLSGRPAPVDAPGGRSGCGAPPAGSCPACPSTDTGSPARSAPDARSPSRRRRGALARRPAGPGSVSGRRARNHGSRCTRSRRVRRDKHLGKSNLVF